MLSTISGQEMCINTTVRHHFTPTRTAASKKTIKNAGEEVGKSEAPTLLEGPLNSAALENSLAAPLMIKHRVTLGPGISTSQHRPKRNGNTSTRKRAHECCKSIVHNSQKVQTTQVWVGGRRTKLWSTHTVEYYSARKRSKP